MIALAAFGPCEWAGFAGAERFPDGREPLIGEMTVDGAPAVVIVDAMGVCIDATGDAPGLKIYILHSGAPAGALVALETAMSGERLVAMGFEFIGGVS